MELVVPKSLVDTNYTEVLCDQLKLTHKHVKIGLDCVERFHYAGTLKPDFWDVRYRGVAIQIYGRDFPVWGRNIWLAIDAEVYVGEAQPNHDFVIFDGKKVLVSNSIHEKREQREGFLSSDYQKLSEFEREFSELVRSAEQITTIREDADPFIKFLNKKLR